MIAALTRVFVMLAHMKQKRFAHIARKPERQVAVDLGKPSAIPPSFLDSNHISRIRR